VFYANFSNISAISWREQILSLNLKLLDKIRQRLNENVSIFAEQLYTLAEVFKGQNIFLPIIQKQLIIFY